MQMSRLFCVNQYTDKILTSWIERLRRSISNIYDVIKSFSPPPKKKKKHTHKQTNKKQHIFQSWYTQFLFCFSSLFHKPFLGFAAFLLRRLGASSLISTASSRLGASSLKSTVISRLGASLISTVISRYGASSLICRVSSRHAAFDTPTPPNDS